MAEIINAEELASYLSQGVTPSLTLVVELTNELVSDAWCDAVSPAPAWVRAIVLNVAARAAANPKGLSSWTRSWDDISRTERVEGGAAREIGVYLTDDETARLCAEKAPGPVQTITVRRKGWPCL